MEQILSLVRRALQEYNMIKSGDHIAAGVSGGKDSLLLLWALSRLRRFYPHPYTLEAVTLDMGPSSRTASPNLDGVARLCQKENVRYTIVRTQFFQTIFDDRAQRSPCSLCARLRRGRLHDTALSLNCRTVALGHNRDDAVETFVLSLLYEGRISCFKPVTWLDRKEITLVRPLLYVPEDLVKRAVHALALPVVHNPCPANGHTKRQEAKEWLLSMETQFPNLRANLFAAMKRDLPAFGGTGERGNA